QLWVAVIVNPESRRKGDKSPWHGYTYELVATSELASDPPQAPRLRLFQTDIRKPLGHFSSRDDTLVVAWRRRITYPASAPYLEALWHPARGETRTIVGLERDDSEESLDRIPKMVQLLKGITAVGGRPPSMEEAAFRQAVSDAFWKLYDQAIRDGGRMPTKTAVASELLM